MAGHVPGRRKIRSGWFPSGFVYTLVRIAHADCPPCSWVRSLLCADSYSIRVQQPVWTADARVLRS
jgi:hypothetical protein